MCRPKHYGQIHTPPSETLTLLENETTKKKLIKSFQLSDVFRETLKLNYSLNEKRGAVCARKEEEPDPYTNALLIYERRVLPMEENCGRPRSRFRGGSMQSAIIYSFFFLVVL